LAKVVKNGGKALMPKTSIGEWGFIANFEDSEGNRIALHSMVVKQVRKEHEHAMSGSGW
jgi:predicted enzyme related to lactoylglutathione lyase